MNELKPCPFCGGMKISIWDKSRYDTCARCDTCNVQTDWLPTISDAIAAWNRRTGKDINVTTNADRIRAMSVDEMAEFLEAETYDSCEHTASWYTDWLQQPVKEE